MSMEREQETFVSRRSLITTLSATLAGTTVAAAPFALATASTPDPLLTLANTNADAELLRLDLEHDAAFKRACTLVDPDNDELNEACAAYVDIEFAIQRIPAETWAGVAVKARIAANYFRKYPEGRVLDDIGPSLIEDILRLANVTAKTNETYGRQA